MRISLLKTAAIAAATTLAGTGIALGTAGAANAATCGGVSINSVSGGTTAIGNSTAGVYLKISATAASNISSWYVTAADVYRGSAKVGTLSYPASSGSSNFSFTFQNSWGRGPFSIRNVAISSYDTGSGHYTCTLPVVTSSFRVLSAIQGNLKYHNVISIRAHGARHSFKLGTSYYTTSGKWKAWKGHKMKVQMKKGKHWKTIKKVKLNKKGKASFTKRIPGKHKFRAIIKGTSTIVGGKTLGTQKL